ncbi:conserved hypothetical protein [Streptomyces sp. e14]|uniref:hypothetical protein n=1 Tax=Streptomyces sp. e14 TaxID=645465 RepID=UPI0001D06663|nr:hypothetical protein [Streptomyces sp. e14]EFF91754.1 conserved hypothetical protein [Streptomyces sp. e14]
MRTHASPKAPDMTTQPFPYQCWAAASPLDEVRSTPLGPHDTTNPHLALHWLQERTLHITDQLDTAYARPGVHWLTDEAEHECALAHMATGTGYQLTLYDDSTRYVLVVYPPGAAS